MEHMRMDCLILARKEDADMRFRGVATPRTHCGNESFKRQRIA